MGQIEFVQEFRGKAAQLNGFRVAGEWARLSKALHADGIVLTADTAARWAGLGYLPAEATPLILDGVSPETAGELDQLATDVAGGSAKRAMQRITELVAEGVLVDPVRVRQVADPDDPIHVFVHVDPQI